MNLSDDVLIKKLRTFNLGKTKQQLVEVLLKSYYVATNYHYHMKNLECMALNEEVKFYRSSYSLQKSYIESVISSFKSKYQEFMNELEERLKQPLRTLIDKFWLMKNESNEENLREFLSYFKLNSTKFEEILKNFDQFPNNDLINVTFEQVLIQLNNQIIEMNKNLMKKVHNYTNELNETNELSIQSDQLLNEIINTTTTTQQSSFMESNANDETC